MGSYYSGNEVFRPPSSRRSNSCDKISCNFQEAYLAEGSAAPILERSAKKIQTLGLTRANFGILTFNADHFLMI